MAVLRRCMPLKITILNKFLAENPLVTKLCFSKSNLPSLIHMQTDTIRNNTYTTFDFSEIFSNRAGKKKTSTEIWGGEGGMVMGLCEKEGE